LNAFYRSFISQKNRGKETARTKSSERAAQPLPEGIRRLLLIPDSTGKSQSSSGKIPFPADTVACRFCKSLTSRKKNSKITAII
jgi:hypothetical protein